jgi:GDYXXLXY protein
MKRLLILAAFQVLVILSWAAYHEHVWATAPTFRVPLRPRDPYDLVRGRYFVLNPQDSTIGPETASLPQQEIARFAGSAGFAGSVQVGFCPVDDVYRVCALALPGEKGPDSARFWSKGFATVRQLEPGSRLDLDLGLSRFFIPNRAQLPAHESQAGWSLEVSYRPGQSLLPRRLFYAGSPIDLR